MDNVVWDQQRKARTGIAEAVFCSNKSNKDLQDIINLNTINHEPVLFTRLPQNNGHRYLQTFEKTLITMSFQEPQ